MSLDYDTSLKNYEEFHPSIRDETKENNIFNVVTEVNILDRLLEEKLISKEFHKINLQRCIKIDKINLNKELFSSMFISSILISSIYYFLSYDKSPLFKFCIFLYILVIYYLSFQYYYLILENV